MIGYSCICFHVNFIWHEKHNATVMLLVVQLSWIHYTITICVNMYLGPSVKIGLASIGMNLESVLCIASSHPLTHLLVCNVFTFTCVSHDLSLSLSLSHSLSLSLSLSHTHTHTLQSPNLHSGQETGSRKQRKNLTSRKRRRNLNVEIDELASLVPLSTPLVSIDNPGYSLVPSGGRPPTATASVDKLSVLRLAMAFMKLKEFMKDSEFFFSSKFVSPSHKQAHTTILSQTGFALFSLWELIS